MSIIQTGVSFQAPPNGWNLNGLYFDAWLKLHHNTSLTITQHPVETGAAITDHSFRNPKHFSFDIGMSDAEASFLPGQFPNNPSRSINAYQTLVSLQETRSLLTLTSKYGVYLSVLIASIDAADDYLTSNASKMTINLQEVILANTETIKVSLNPQATDVTNRGQVSAQPIPGSIEAIIQDILDLGAT